MIENIRHKGLRRLYERGDQREIRTDMRGRIDRILLILDEAETMDDMNIPGFRLPPLTGDREGM